MSADVLQLQSTIGNRAVGRLLSEIRSPSFTVQQLPIQKQEIPEEEEPLQGMFESKPDEKTCPSYMQRQEIPEEEEPLQGKMYETIQRLKPEEEEKLQMKSIMQRQEIPEEEEPLQGKMIGTIQRQEIPEDEEPLQAKRENNTEMPDNLKAGVENLSGIDMSDVRVHYNSSKPAEIGALAYTQGTNIHVAPGQERHLPHEAWHVVQQTQGRVKPTMQLKDGVPINDDGGLEYEADVMGENAINVSKFSHVVQKSEEIQKSSMENVVQCEVRERINYVPPTGIGKFDASYDTDSHEFHINVKVHLRFKENITHEEREQFKLKFIENTAGKWNGRFHIRCIKPGVGITVVPHVTVALVDNEGDSHYSIQISKDEDLRELDDGTPVGGFAAVSAHDENPNTPTSGSIHLAHADISVASTSQANEGVATREAARAKQIINNDNLNPISFKTHSDELNNPERGRIINCIARITNSNAEMKTVPIGLKIIGTANKRELLDDKLSYRRAQVVSTFLNDIPEVHEKITSITPISSGVNGHRSVNIIVDDSFASNWKNKKVVVTHEFGHMLGVPDFYPRDPSLRLRHQQEAFRLLVSTSGNHFEEPRFDTFDASVMSAGTLILKHYYVTLVRVLADITSPDISYNEWVIEDPEAV